MTDTRICVDLAVNNDAGNFSGELAAVSISDVAQLDGDTLTVRLYAVPPMVAIEGQEFRYYRSIEWHGNMAWNGYEMTIADAARLLEALRRNHWTIIEAEVRLFGAYDAGAPLESVLVEALKETPS